ncbi:EamA family transporter [Galbitalea soli]|uniref:DMT family transporter n=1 Tax=Galbitalea soli TaxID=1268042 RepID=A0A7C9TSG0_9MICO|nr:DMT family transporter [Galbitalea soli]NEM91603.1 DMT family transporter [Galbitalea soli]NYJ30297.1 drug/metabolite transporter (DMT)-like permease [Galbitalea soli]
MARSTTTRGLLIAIIAAACFGMSGALVKPLLEAGWTPAAAVTARALIGAVALAPFALVALRGRWSTLWRARGRILVMAGIGVAGTQLVYFAAVQRIPIGTAILMEYTAPLLLVLLAWARTRRVPRLVVIIGSVLAVAGLVLVVAPQGGVALDTLGVVFSVLGMIGCAIYYLAAAIPSDGLPPVAFAASGLLLGGLALGAVGLLGIVPFAVTTTAVRFGGVTTAWWVPVLIVGVLSTGLAYAASITSSELLGSRLASFMGLLEVVAATLYAWVLLGEGLTVAKGIGGVLILTGIAFVRSEKADDAPLEPGSGADGRGVAGHPDALEPAPADA